MKVKLDTMTIEQLKLEMALHDPRGSVYKAAFAELEERYKRPPDMSNEPAIVEVLQRLATKKVSGAR